MAQEFDALKLLRQEQAANRDRFARKHIATQRTNLKRHKSYTFVGRDANSGNAVVSQNGQVVSAGEITSNALIKPGQNVRVLMAPGKVTVKQLPKRGVATKKRNQPERIARLKWLAIIHKGNDLEFYLCGARSAPKKVFTFRNFLETIPLTIDPSSIHSYRHFSTAYATLDYSGISFPFDGVFSNLGAGEDQWMYTFGHSECLSLINPPGVVEELIRRNRFYKLTPQGLTVFFEETVSYGASPAIGQLSAKMYDYTNCGNGFFSRRIKENDYRVFAANYGILAGRYHTLNRFSFISDQGISAPETVVDGKITTASMALGASEVIEGSMNFTPKLKPPIENAFEYAQIPAFFFDFNAQVWAGTDIFPSFQMNRQGTAALAFGRYVRAGELWNTNFLASSKGLVQSPTSEDRLYNYNNYGVGYAVAPYNGEIRRWKYRGEMVLKDRLARFKDFFAWQADGTGEYWNSSNLNAPFNRFNGRFAAKAARTTAEIELYDFEWQLKQTVKVPYYKHKPFVLKSGERIWQITNASYSG